ncbi:sulfatase-like hydrolase/transferase [Chryseobacterium sp. ISL-6]|uniref:sulfatase-like hydrolase/transferase n=1 Tax=Chryseobacterium sp. ISL-6 TaxID=2819143 RepID=UPI001BECE2A1|nr:sulfatase-like hydrolase/transferase [Chryseobacterium sp. ISL-6]MBT2619897.1 sulfatase-like hydrolase/transferase [Chryseobacterium sp. ISL-6]
MKTKFFLIFMLFAQLAGAQNTKTKNIVLISIDGYRWQEIFKGADSSLLQNKKFRQQDSTEVYKKFWAETEDERRKKLMPFFWNVISKKGQLYGNRNLNSPVNVKNKYWFSYPGRSETVTGFYDEKINSNSYPNNPNENVLEFINKQKDYQGKVVIIAGWDAVSKIVNRDRNHMPVINPFENAEGKNLTEAQKLANEIQNYLPNYFGRSVRWDVGTYAIAKTYIAANHPKMVYIDFADPDDLGHAGQYDYYLDSAHYLDAMIGNLWAAMQADPFYKDNTTFIICPDHGRGLESQWTSHGSSSEHSNETWLIALGPDTPPSGEMKNTAQIYQDQIAQTIASLLGFTFKTNHPVGESIKSVVGK